MLTFCFFSCNEVSESRADEEPTGNERSLPKNMVYSYDCIKKDSGSISDVLGKADDILGKVATFNIEVTDGEQNSFGEMFLNQSLQNENFRIDSTSPLNIKLQAILAELLKKRVAPSDIKYKMYLLHDTASINAYTVGGKIFITKAMLNKCTNDDQLYAIIGHEIGHNEKGHIKKSIKQIKATNRILGSWGNTFLAIKRILTGSFNHKNELEADYYGLDLTWKSGYDICAIQTFWNDMAKGEQRNAINDFFRTHPYSDTRSLCLVRHIQRNFKLDCR